MKFAFGRRSSDLRAINVAIFGNALTRPLAKTIGHNLNSPRARQDSHALRVQICMREGTVMTSRVRGQSEHIHVDIATLRERERIAIDRLWEQRRRNQRHDTTRKSYYAEIGLAKLRICDETTMRANWRELVALHLNIQLWDWNCVLATICKEMMDNNWNEGDDFCGNSMMWTLDHWTRVLVPCVGKDGDFMFEKESVRSRAPKNSHSRHSSRTHDRARMGGRQRSTRTRRGLWLR